MDWSMLLSSVVSAAVGAGIVGVAFWRLLDKGLDAKLKDHQIKLTAALNQQTEIYKLELNAEVSRQLEGYKTALAVSTHRENTVFSRIDQQRSDTLQKLGAQLGSFRMELMSFSPRTPIGSKLPNDPAQDAIVWCMNLILSTKEPVKTAFSHSLLLPVGLPAEIGAWHACTHAALCKLLEGIQGAIQSDDFNALADEPMKQRSALAKAKNTWAESQQTLVASLNNNLENRLRKLFESVDRPHVGGELPVNQEPTPPPGGEEVASSADK